MVPSWITAIAQLGGVLESEAPHGPAVPEKIVATPLGRSPIQKESPNMAFSRLPFAMFHHDTVCNGTPEPCTAECVVLLSGGTTDAGWEALHGNKTWLGLKEMVRLNTS